MDRAAAKVSAVLTAYASGFSWLVIDGSGKISLWWPVAYLLAGFAIYIYTVTKAD